MYEDCTCSLSDALADGHLAPGAWDALALRVLHQVAGALAYLHAAGGCHGRLHPSNVLLKVVRAHALSSARVKLADYVGPAPDVADLVRARTAAGSPPR